MIQKLVALFWLERPARKLTMSAWGERLAASGETIAQKLDKIPDSQQNKQVLREIISAERWGQGRLRVGLGDPSELKDDTHDAHRSAMNRSWEQLKTEFRITRRKTVALAEELDNRQVDQFVRVKHNRYGAISLGAWLRYLDVHTKLKSRQLK